MAVKLPTGAKPSKVTSKDATRPQLQSAVLAQEDDGWVIYATDSYRLLKLPVEVDGDDTAGLVSQEAMRAAEKTGCFKAETYVEPLTKAGGQNGGLLFRRPEPAKADEPIPPWTKLEWPEEPKKRFRIGLNAKFLYEVAQALGAKNDGVVLELDLAKAAGPANDKHYLKAYVVRGMGRDEGAALLMPVRVNG